MAQSIYLNMIPNTPTPRVYLSQYDVGETIDFILFYDSMEYTPPVGATVKVQGTKPSGFGYTVTATVDDNVASIEITDDMTGEAGNVISELVVTESGDIIGSKNFIIEIEKSPHPNGIIDGNAEEVIPELTQLVERVEDAASSVLDRQTVTNTLPAGSQASYSFDEETNTQTFGIPQGEAGAGAVDVTASAYSSSKTYAVGDYVIHNDYLYRCTTAITTAEAWTSGHWTQVFLGDDVSDLKSALNDTANLLQSGNFEADISYTAEKGILVSNGSESSLSGYATWAVSNYIPIPAGTKTLESNARSGSDDYGYAFYDENYQFISGSSLGHYNTFSVTVLPTYKFFRFTSYKADSDHSGVYLKGYGADSIGSLKAENEYITDSLEVIGNNSLQLDDVDIATQKAIASATGIETSLSGYTTWGCTDFIEIPIGTYKIESNAASGSADYGYAFYDENKQFVIGSTIRYTNGFSANVLPTYKYIRFTDYKANSDHSGVYIKFDANKYGFHNERNAQLEDVIDGATLLIGNFTLNSAIQLSENQHIKGSNCVITVGENGRLVMNNGASISGVKFVGDWNPTRQSGDGTTYTSFGYVPLISYNDLATGNTDALLGQDKSTSNAVIYIQSSYAFNATVENCIFEGFDRLAIYAGGQHHQEKTNPLICNNYFVDCRMGIYVEGEFARVYANEYLRCIVGCCLLGGNANNFGEIFKCCDCGYYFPYTPNNTAHNEITSCEAAHCGLAGIYIRELRANLGCQVTGSHFPDSPIVGLAVNNLVLVGCRVDTWFKYDSGKGNSIICSNVGKSYLYGHTLFDVPQDTLITLNRGLGTTPDTDVNWN